MMNRWLVVALAACALSVLSCGGGHRDSSPPPRSASSSRACETIKDLARTCYDSSDPGTSCTDLRAATERAGEKASMKPELQAKLGRLCEASCMKRKEGVPWSRISEKMDCD